MRSWSFGLYLVFLIAAPQLWAAAGMRFSGATAVSGGRLWLPCSQGECMVDTAGEGSIISENAASLLYPKVGEVELDTVLGRKKCDLIRPAGFELAGSPVSVEKFLRCSFFPAENSPMLGLSVFEGRRFTFQFSRMQFDWDFSARAPQRRLQRIAPWVAVPLDFPGLTVPAVFDTGAPITLVDESIFREHPEMFGRILNPGEAFKTVELLYPVAVGGRVLRGSAVMVLDLRGHFGPSSPLVFLGLNHIRGANWSFDLKADTFAVE